MANRYCREHATDATQSRSDASGCRAGRDANAASGSSVCLANRPAGRPGRKPRRKREDALSGSDGRADAQPLCVGNRVTKCRASLIGAATVPQGVMPPRLIRADLREIFSIGPASVNSRESEIMPRLLVSKTTLRDGFLACAISWDGDVDGHPSSGSLGSCYQHASSALATLASFQVTNVETMTDCLMLGAFVATFAIKLRVNDLLTICSRTLDLIAPMYALNDPASDGLLVFLNCMVMHEVSGCLFDCTAPTLRFRPPEGAYVDRHAGLCATLLPLFYDICKLNHALAHGLEADRDTRTALDELDRSVQEWLPVVPDNFTTRFTAIEVAHMLCQAQVLRLTALLVLHRLRYPFGMNDAPAQALSVTILSQLEMTFHVTGQHVRCVNLALLVACLELKGPERQRWLSNVTAFAGYSSHFGEHVEGTLESYWAAIDMFETLSWQELAALGSPFLRNRL